MNKFKITAGLLLIFILGGLSGSLGTYICMKEKFREMVQAPPGLLIPRFISKLERELDLNPEQKTEVRKNADALQKELNAFMEKNRPLAEEIFSRHTSGIKSVLNPEQQKQMDRIQEKVQKRWMKKKGRHRRGSHRGPNPDKILSRMRHRLSLSDEQADQIRPLMIHIFEKASCPKGNCGSSEMCRGEWWKTKPELEKELEKILTAEQMRLFKELP